MREMFISLYLLALCLIQRIYSAKHAAEVCPNYPSSYGGYSKLSWWCERLCGEAADESPIDIDTSDLLDGEGTCTSRLDWKVYWKQDLFKIKNDCNTLKVTPMSFDDADILGPSTDARTAAAVLPTEDTPFDEDYDYYCLAQVHFHWGINATLGSEHTVDGKAYPLEAHFVHYACEYRNVTAAAKRGAESTLDGDDDVDHTLAVVGILFEISDEDNPALDAILSDAVLDTVSNCSESGEVILRNPLFNYLIPRHVEHGGYYAYKGSLTTPPCNDDVNWFVMKTKGSVSQKQLEQFRKLLDEDDEVMERNWRGVQNNTNQVMDCDDDDYYKYNAYRRYRKHKHRRPWYKYQEAYE